MRAIQKGWTQSHKWSCEREVSSRNQEFASGRPFTFWHSGSKRPLGESRFFRPNQYSRLTLESILGFTLNSSSRLWISSPRFRLSTEGSAMLATRTRILATVYKTVVSDWELGTDQGPTGVQNSAI